MKKLKPLLLLVVIGAIVVFAYSWMDSAGWLSSPSGSSEAPKLADQKENDENNKGGQLEGNTEGKGQEKDPSQGKDDEQGKDADPESGAGQGSGEEGEAGQAVFSNGEDGTIAVIAKPESIEALVNPFNKLPEDYTPQDLVYPDVRFLFTEKIDKRKMRKEAAEALEKLFKGAEEDGIYLAGVSAYRSHATQKQLFDRYVKKDGLEKAKTYSAFPGTSEHETGLAIDVTSSDGKCAVDNCFGDMKEADWLAKYASEYGFIIRYPEGKKEITGYQYEPWHLRYVGVDLSKELAASGETLEEYYNAIPVNAK